MKKLFGLWITSCFLTFSLYAQSDCSTYYPFKEGSVLEYQSLDKKGKLVGTTSQTLKEVKQEGNSITAMVTGVFTDKKGKEQGEVNFGITCDENRFTMDIQSIIPNLNMGDMATTTEEDMEIQGDGFMLPSDPKVGDELPDSENIISLKMGPMSMKMTINITEHKIEAKEKVTTAAGTFDCIKASYVTSTKIMMNKSQIKVVNWYAKGVGMIKSESYNNKNGKLMSTEVLTKYSK